MNQESIYIGDYIWSLLLFLVLAISIGACCCISCWNICFKKKKQFHDSDLSRRLEKLEAAKDASKDIESQENDMTEGNDYEDVAENKQTEEEMIKENITFGDRNKDYETPSYEDTELYEVINRGENENDVPKNLDKTEEETIKENVEFVKDNMHFQSDLPRYEEVAKPNQYEDILKVQSSATSSSSDEDSRSQDDSRKESVDFRKENMKFAREPSHYEEFTQQISSSYEHVQNERETDSSKQTPTLPQVESVAIDIEESKHETVFSSESSVVDQKTDLPTETLRVPELESVSIDIKESKQETLTILDIDESKVETATSSESSVVQEETVSIDIEESKRETAISSESSLVEEKIDLPVPDIVKVQEDTDISSEYSTVQAKQTSVAIDIDESNEETAIPSGSSLDEQENKSLDVLGHSTKSMLENNTSCVPVRNNTRKSIKQTRKIKCSQCDRKFHEEVDLNKHISMSHQKKHIDESFTPACASTAKGNLSEQLEFANRTSRTNRSMKRQAQKAREKKILCDGCDAKLATDEGLRLHKISYHKMTYVS